MTHGTHRLCRPPARRRADPAPADRRRRLLPDLRDGRRALRHRRCTRAEVLAAPLRAARPAGSRRPRLRRGAAGAGGAVQDPAARRLARGCSRTRTPASARCSPSRRRPSALSSLAAIALCPLRHPRRRRPSAAGRLRTVVEPRLRAHRLRDARRSLGSQPQRAATARCWSAPPTSRPGGRTDGGSPSCGQVRCGRCARTASTSAASLGAPIPTGHPTAAVWRSTARVRPIPPAGGTAALRRMAGLGTDPAYAPDGRLAVVRDGQIFVGGNAVATGTSPTGRPAAASRGFTTASSTWPASATTGACSPHGIRH